MTFRTSSLAIAAAYGVASCTTPVGGPAPDAKPEIVASGGAPTSAPVDRAPSLPHPRAFGLDLTGAAVLEPTTMVVPARRVRALHPRVTALEITTDLDLHDDEKNPWSRRLSVRGIGPGDGGSVLIDRDSRNPAAGVEGGAELAEAIAADLADARASRAGGCAASKAAAANAGGPFGANFWNAQPCEDADAREMASGTALQLAVASALSTGTPAWAAACAEHVEPAAISACENLVGQISGNLTQATARVEAARASTDVMDSIAHEALDLAAQLNLGFGGLAGELDAAELATMALETIALKAAADRQASLAVGNLIAARGLVNLDPVLQATTAPTVLGGLIVLGNTWQVDIGELSTCYQRLVSWIAGAAGIGLAFRLFGPGGPNVVAGGAVAGSLLTSGVLVHGPREMQSLAFFFSDPIVIDFDQLSSADRALARWSNGPHMGYHVWAAYEEPGYDETLPADVIVPDPWTLLPTVAAPAGARVWPGGDLYDGPENYVQDTYYSPFYNTVFLGGIGLDIDFTETDAAGQDLSIGWEWCAGGPPVDPLAPRYCQFGLYTTAPPHLVGQPVTRYFRFWMHAGIIDPADGTIIEPEGSQVFVQFRATGEHPGPCYTWDSVQGQYVYQPGPGCEL